jgi:malate dehydrogenase
MTEPIQIAVAGAAGRISYNLLFRIAAGAMFGLDKPVSLRLLEVPTAMPLIDATMMELSDCTFPLLRSVKSFTDAAEAFAGADWVILVGSAPYRPGMNRSEALLANAPVYLAQGRAINESAKTARVLVVANPCATNCLIAQTTARDVPPDHFFAMTRLDENRARAMIAVRANVPAEQVTRVTVWGDHGPSAFADVQNAWIGDRPALEVLRDRDWVRGVLEPGVAGRPKALHDLRGASPAASATQAILGTVRSMLNPTPFTQWFNAAVVSDGSYGVPRGLVFGFPIRTDDGQSWSIVQSHYLDAHAQNRIAEIVAELEREAAVVTDFLPARSR